MNIFQAVKQSVTARQAASFYGVTVGKNGMACCPFHDDKHPSMKMDERFYCFGCGEKGDVIDFVAKLHEESLPDAANRIVADFHVSVDGAVSPRKKAACKQTTTRHTSDKEVSAIVRKTMESYYDRLCAQARFLRTIQQELSPKTPEQEYHPLFVLSLEHLGHVEYLLDVLFYGEWDEKQAVFVDCGKELKEIERRVEEYVRGNRNTDTRNTKRDREISRDDEIGR